MKKLCTTLLILVAFLAVAGIAYADELEFKAKLSGAQEVPEVGTDATGKIEVKCKDDLSEVEVKLRVRDMVATAAHFHCAFAGANGDIAFGIVNPGPVDCDPLDLAAGDLECTLTNADFTGEICLDNIIHAHSGGRIGEGPSPPGCKNIVRSCGRRSPLAPENPHAFHTAWKAATASPVRRSPLIACLY